MPAACAAPADTDLTGQYAHANGIIDNTNRSSRSHEMHTFPRDLQRAGYDTAFIGKWHAPDAAATLAMMQRELAKVLRETG